MKLLPCKCGTKFRVKPEFAGKVITTPCCKIRIRVPGNADSTQQANPNRVRVQCSCGQAIAMNRPKAAVEIQCPTCKRKLRFGTPAAQQVVAPLPVPDDIWSQPPDSSNTFRNAPKKGKKSRTSSGRKKSKRKTKNRIPRIGLFKEEFGVASFNHRRIRATWNSFCTRNLPRYSSN